MKIALDKTHRFIHAMVNMMGVMKESAEECCAMCGGLSEKDLFIINHVGQHHDLRMKDIAEHMRAPISTLTSIVDKLVESNHLSRYHSAEDRRVVMVTLAKKGKKAFDTFIAQKIELAGIILAEYNKKEQEQLVAFMEKIPALVLKAKEIKGENN